jgi:intermediate cleaving peptidase 55
MCFRTILGYSANACVIHYTQNDQLLQPGELLLLDAGCEYSHYASDITRTFPVSGKFSEPQKDLYQAVLNVQKKCVEKCRVEDEVGMGEIHRLSEFLVDDLKAV